MPFRNDDCINTPRCSTRAARHRCDPCKKKHASYMKQYRDNNLEHSRAEQRKRWAARTEEQKERIKEYRREWHKTPAGRESQVRARHGRLSRKGELSPGSWLITLLADPCSYCGGPGGEIDHIVPIARGGANDMSNLTASCRKCNARKKDQHMLVFLSNQSTT